LRSRGRTLYHVSHCSNGKSAERRNDSILKSFQSGNAGLWAGLSLESAMWILLLVPFIGLLWVPFYNFAEPSLFGFPFFYWYQLAWVPISSLLIWLVYRGRTPDQAP
jgi:hypothetical protein